MCDLPTRTLLQIHLMQFISHFAWGAEVISFGSLLICPLLCYVSDVWPEHNHTIFNHPPPFVASQARILGTISRWRQSVIARRVQVYVVREGQGRSADGSKLHGRERSHAHTYIYLFIYFCVNSLFLKKLLNIILLHNGLHGVISQKMILFITTAVKTSNRTLFCL
jgi:hypothetical protein